MSQAVGQSEVVERGECHVVGGVRADVEHVPVAAQLRGAGDRAARQPRIDCPIGVLADAVARDEQGRVRAVGAELGDGDLVSVDIAVVDRDRDRTRRSSRSWRRRRRRVTTYFEPPPATSKAWYIRIGVADRSARHSAPVSAERTPRQNAASTAARPFPPARGARTSSRRRRSSQNGSVGSMAIPVWPRVSGAAW